MVPPRNVNDRLSAVVSDCRTVECHPWVSTKYLVETPRRVNQRLERYDLGVGEAVSRCQGELPAIRANVHDGAIVHHSKRWGVLNRRGAALTQQSGAILRVCKKLDQLHGTIQLHGSEIPVRHMFRLLSLAVRTKARAGLAQPLQVARPDPP